MSLKDGRGVVAPTRVDPIAAASSELIGGPVGDHAAPHRWWTPVQVLLLVFTFVFALGLVQHGPCMQTDWNNSDVRYAKMCYSDIPYLYTGRGFAEQHWPYADSHGRYPAMEYPVGISYLAWFASELTTIDAAGPPVSVRAAADPADLWGMPGMATEINANFAITAVLLFLCGLIAAWFLAGTHRRRPWDALPFVLSPCLLMTGLVNWDLLAVAFTAGALWAWSRGKPLWAGLLVGLGVATKLYPLFLLGAFLVVAIRRRRLSWFAWAAGGAAVAWLLANLPALLSGFDLWKVFWKFNSKRGADLGSLWYVLSLKGHNFSAHQINVVSWVVFLAACAAILALGLLVKQPPRVAQLAFLIVAAFLLVNKVYSPQYVLWLLPLAVLARPRWRDLLIWQACELFYFASVWWFLGGWLTSASTNAGSPIYEIAIVVRMLGEIYLMALVVRDIVWPGHDPVRADGVTDDPMTPEAAARPRPQVVTEAVAG
jgi:uncharacterized membrane protein